MKPADMRERGGPSRGGEAKNVDVRVNGDGTTNALRHRFGGAVRELRQRNQLTQEALAERSDLSVDAIRRIEAGRFSPTLETLRKLSEGLEVSLPTLFQSLGDDRPDHVAEICDYLSRRNNRELKLAWKVLHAMFDDK